MKVFGRYLSLRMRLTAWSVSVVALALLVFGVTGYLGLRNYLKASLQQSFRSTAGVIEHSFLEKVPARGEAWAIEQIHQDYPAAKTQRMVRISTGGRVLYQTGPLDVSTPSAFESIPMPSDSSAEGVFHRYPVGREMFLMYSQRYVTSSGETYQVDVAGALGIMTNTLRSLLRTYLISMPLILLFAAIGGLALMKRPLAPLLSLTSKADSIGKNELGERLPVQATGDEIQSLAVSLNRMIDRLEEALAHNRRFSADASHELRTPLSILRGEMEEMLRCPGLPVQAAGNTVSALEEIERMSRIVQGLMDITRLDAGGERMHLQLINLSSLAQTTVDQMRLLADASYIPLTLDAPAELMIVADPFRVKQVLVNLIDNAIKYTPEANGPEPGRDIQVRLGRQGEAVAIDVLDHGVGIAPEALPRVFDRFYRAEESRNRRAGGSGLGLAIVKAIVTAHGGTVSAENAGPRGTVMRVHLPVGTDASSSGTANTAVEQDFAHLSLARG